MSTKNICPVASPPETKFATLARDLRLQIVSGALLPGSKLPSYPAMQERGVSQPVLDRAYALLESEGLIERRRRSGVFVAHAARLSKVAGTQVLGIPSLLAQHQETAYFHLLFDGMRRAAERAGYDLLICQDLSTDRLARMDGVLWTTADYKLPKRMLPEGMPWVSVLWEAPNTPSLTVDEKSGVSALVNHLLSLGHRNIGYLVVEWADGERHSAYMNSFRQASVSVSPLLTRPLHARNEADEVMGFFGHGYRAMKTWLKSDWRKLGCTALLVHNDEAAAGVMRAAHEEGIRVPRDLSVVGFDGTPFANLTDPPLTTVEVPLRSVGERSVEMLLQLLAGEQVHSQVLPTQLKVGSSSCPPRL